MRLREFVHQKYFRKMSGYRQRQHRDGERSRQEDETPEMYSIFRGEVASIQSYGAFVKIPGCRKNGLVHKTQISSARVEDVSEVLAVGDHVFCKVISLGDEDNSKISLSMKVVDQGQGKDLDPNLVQMKQEEQRRKKGQAFSQPKIELGAVFNTVCRKCGTKGHLAKDCFQAPGGKTYDILPDDDGISPLDANEISMTSPQKREKKKKKKGKKKKSKKHRRRSVTSDSSDSESDSSGDEHPDKHRQRHHHSSKTGKDKVQKHRHHRSLSPDATDSESGSERHPHKHHRTSKRGRDEHHRSSSPVNTSSGRHRHKHHHTSADKHANPVDRHKRKRHTSSESDGSSSSNEYHHRHGHRSGAAASDRHPPPRSKTEYERRKEHDGHSSRQRDTPRHESHHERGHNHRN